MSNEMSNELLLSANDELNQVNEQLCKKIKKLTEINDKLHKEPLSILVDDLKKIIEQRNKTIKDLEGSRSSFIDKLHNEINEHKIMIKSQWKTICSLRESISILRKDLKDDLPPLKNDFQR